MCIDTLHIYLQSRRGRSVTTDSRANLDDATRRLVLAGYDCTETSQWAGGARRSFYVLSPDTNEEALKIIGRNNGDESFIESIEARPILFRRWSDFWNVLDTMEDRTLFGGRHRIIDQAHINRIDYTLDIEASMDRIMRGLYINRSQTLIAYSELEAPYIQRQWKWGYFYSFNIGKEPKVIKIYDKNLERAARRTAAPNDLDAAWDDAPTNTTNQPQRPPEAPRTRIEIKVTRQADIAGRIWNRYSEGRYEGREHYNGMLAELPQHLEDIRLGFTCPFKGILLNHIADRSPDFDKTVPAHQMRHEINMGLLMNLYQRMGSDFWQEHQRAFSIHPWNRPQQPTQLYRTRMSSWLHNGLNFSAAGVPDKPYNPESRLTERWPVELTHFG